MTRAELQPLPPPWRSQALSPANSHDADSGIYMRRSYKLMCRSCADALAAASDDEPNHSQHFEQADEVHIPLQRMRTTNEETAQLMTRPGPVADQAVKQLNEHAPKLFMKGKGGSRDAPNRNYACQLLEVLNEFQLLPFSANEAALQPTLVPAPQPLRKDGGDSETVPSHTHACFGVHFGSEFPATSAVCSRYFQATRPKLHWELRDNGLTQDVAELCKALESINVLASHNNIQGPALVLHIPSKNASNEGTGEVRSTQVAAAAALALSPGGCFVTRLSASSIAAQACLEVSAVAGAAFEGVFLYHPSCAPIAGSDSSIWLVARNKRALSQDAANGISRSCRLLNETSCDDMHDWRIPVPQDLRQCFVGVCEWAAERAEAELLFAKLSINSSDGSEMLLGLGQRWAKFYNVPSLFHGNFHRKKLKGWLKDPPPPRAAPRIPAGLAQQHMAMEVPMEATEPPPVEATAMDAAAPFANPDTASTDPPAPVQAIPEAAVAMQLRTSEAPTAGSGVAVGEEQHVQEFQGEIMTYNESKGWERVAMVQSHGWPAGVPIPKQFRIHKFAAKPPGISRFWAISPRSQADSQQLTSLLGYMNRPASSLGGRKRMGVMNAQGPDGLDMGVVAGSDGSGGIGGIVFCLRDAQMS